jgi:hypothetical protein
MVFRRLCHSYIEQFLQRVNDLVGLDVPEDVDNLPMPRFPIRVHHILQRERLAWGNYSLACCRKPCLRIRDDVESDVAGVGLAGNVCGHSLLQGSLEGNRDRRRPVPQSGE